MTIIVRPESPADIASIRMINEAAFGGAVETELVDRLRTNGDLVLSLVADTGGGTVGYCGFARLTITSDGGSANGVALAPVAVLPAWQKQGVGQRMVRNGIERMKGAGETLIFVVGEPGYYKRFGFDAGAATPFRTPYDGPHLQMLRLRHDAPAGGAVRYPHAFAAL